jgi:hypothetical protein
MKRKIAVLSLLVAMLLATAGCGSKTSTGTADPSASPAATAGTHHVFLAKTRFLTDMGLGAYAFYHFVYQRYLNGEFTSGKLTSLAGVYAKAAIALLFAYNRFNQAYKLATTSDDKVLNFVAAPLNKLKAHFDKEHTQLQHGHFSADDMVALNNESQSFYNLTHANGYTITQIPAMIPGAS